MATVIIKKRINLGFLGEDYTEGYLEFKAPGIDEIAGIDKQAEKADSDEASSKFLKEFLGSKLLSGKFPNVEKDNELEDFTKENVGDLDIATIIYIFKILGGGVAADPKELDN